MKACNHWYQILWEHGRKQNSVKAASFTRSKTRGTTGRKLVIKTRKLLSQNHRVHMSSCARTATDCANRGLVSAAIWENVPQPTLQTLLHSLRNWRMPIQSVSGCVCQGWCGFWRASSLMIVHLQNVSTVWSAPHPPYTSISHTRTHSHGRHQTVATAFRQTAVP